MNFLPQCGFTLALFIVNMYNFGCQHQLPARLEGRGVDNSSINIERNVQKEDVDSKTVQIDQWSNVLVKADLSAVDEVNWGFVEMVDLYGVFPSAREEEYFLVARNVRIAAGSNPIVIDGSEFINIRIRKEHAPVVFDMVNRIPEQRYRVLKSSEIRNRAFDQSSEAQINWEYLEKFGFVDVNNVPVPSQNPDDVE